MMQKIRQTVWALRWREQAVREHIRRRAFSIATRRAWAQIRAEQLSYTSDAQLHQLLRVVRRTASSSALIIEAGCARGGSAILMCATKSIDRPMRVYDMFDMIPPPSEHDGDDMKARYKEIVAGKAVGIDGGRYYLYEDDMLATVSNNFRRFGYPVAKHRVELIKGKVQDTLVVDEAVALAHIDVDWYEPVSRCLERIVPRLMVGGAIAVHAYSDWSGSRKASDDYFKSADRSRFDFDVSAGHLLVTRTR